MLQDQPASGVTTPTPMLVAVDDGLEIPIDQPVLLIGRSKRRAHYRINDPHVSSVHCEIHAKDGQLHVRDCSRHGTRINGRKVDESELFDGDILQIVKHRFRVERGVAGPRRDSSPDPPTDLPLSKADPDRERFSPEKENSKRQHTGPVVRDSWFVRMAGVELGPMPWSDIVDMTRNHEVTRADEVRQEFESEWKCAGNVRSLFPTSEDSAAPNSTPAATETATWESSPQLVAERLASEAEFDSPATGPNLDAAAEPTTPEPPETISAAVGASAPQADAITEEDASEPPHVASPSPEDEPAEEVIDLDGESDLSDFVPGDDEIPDRPASVHRKSTAAPRRRAALDYEPDPDNPRYFMRRKSREFGPLEFEKLQTLAAEGRLSELDSIRTDVNPDWVSAATVKDLFAEGGSRDLSDEAYSASLLAEMDQKDNLAGPDTPPALISEREATAPSSEFIPASAGDPGCSPSALTSLPPLPVPAARDDSRRKMAGDALAPLIYLQTVLQTPLAMAVGVVLVAMLLYSLIPSFEGSVVLGRVTLDGQPLKDSSITFTDTSAGIEASGLINEDGTYVVTTMEGGMNPGKYTVTFAPVKPEPDAVIEQLQRQRQYLAGQGPGGALEQDLKTEDPASSASREKPIGRLPPGTIPMKYRASNSSRLSVEVVDGRNKFPFELTSK